MRSAVSVRSLSSVQATSPIAFLQSRFGKIVASISATALIAACAHVSLALPFTPVPLTLQDFAVLLTGMALGPVAGFCTLMLYLAEGALSLPVFNPQGLGGIAQLLGPTAGYLLSYPFAAATAGLAGKLAEGRLSSFTAAVITGAIASIIVLSSGALWIAHLHNLSSPAAWTVAVAPFLYGAGAKIVAAALIFSSLRRWSRL